MRARIRLGLVTAFAGALVVGGLVLAPAAHAAISGSHITTPSNPSFLIDDQDAGESTLAISGTTTGGNPSTDTVDILCYFAGISADLADDVPLAPDGSFSIAVPLLFLTGTTCRLRAVPTGTTPSDPTPFSGPVVSVGLRQSFTVAGGPNAGRVTGYFLDAQQETGSYTYLSLGDCGLGESYLYDPTYAPTAVTFLCNASLLSGESPSPTRSELQIDGTNAYAPSDAASINDSAGGLPALTDTYSLDKATGNVVIHESDPLVTCSEPTYPPTANSCPTFASAGVTDERTIEQADDGHLSLVSDSFRSTDGKAHSLDLEWDNSQAFGPFGAASQVEYEFPGESGFSTHVAGDDVSLPPSAGTIFIRSHGAPDGDTATGRGAIVYDRPATGAMFTDVVPGKSEFTLSQTGTVPAGSSTGFRFAYVQGYRAATVATLAAAASAALLDRLTVSRSGKGKGAVTSSPGGIACGRTCSHGYAFGTSVTLTARAAKGSRFTGWAGACRGGGRCTITTDDDFAIKAKFALKPCVVPDVVGKSLRAAKFALKRAYCSVGKISYASSSRKKGKVVSQQPRPHKRLRQHAMVSLVVSKG
jgi:hypothetical protein